MGTHPIFESDFDCLTELIMKLLAILFSISSAFFATILPRREECFHESGKAGDKVSVIYEVAEGGFLDIDVKVFNPLNKVMYDQQRETSGKVMFTLETAGKVRVCFSNKISTVTHKVVMFNLDLIEGAGPNTDESHSKLETMMADLAQQMTTVKHEQEYMEVRERIHTAINENTNSRVVLWAFFESIVLIVMTLGQVYYLKRFFEVRRVV